MSKNSNVTITSSVAKTQPVRIETIAPKGFTPEAIALCNRQLHQMLVAQAEGDRERVQYLLGAMLDQMHYNAEQFAVDRAHLDPSVRRIERSEHPLWLAIMRSVEKLSGGFLATARCQLDREATIETSLECLNELVKLILEGRFGVREDMSYISAVQNAVTFNGVKPGPLLGKAFDPYTFSYTDERVTLNKDGQTVRSTQVKTGRALAESLPDEEERADVYMPSAVPGIEIEEDMTPAMIFSDIVLKVATNRILSTDKFIDAFCDYCRYGDIAWRDDKKSDVYKSTVKALKTNLANRSDGCISRIKRELASDDRLEEDEVMKYSMMLDAAKKLRGGLKRLIHEAARQASPETYKACFGDREILDCRGEEYVSDEQ